MVKSLKYGLRRLQQHDTWRRWRWCAGTAEPSLLFPSAEAFRHVLFFGPAYSLSLCTKSVDLVTVAFSFCSSTKCMAVTGGSKSLVVPPGILQVLLTQLPMTASMPFLCKMQCTPGALLLSSSHFFNHCKPCMQACLQTFAHDLLTFCKSYESLLGIDGHAYKPAHTILLCQQNHGACLLCLQLYNCCYFSSLPN